MSKPPPPDTTKPDIDQTPAVAALTLTPATAWLPPAVSPSSAALDEPNSAPRSDPDRSQRPAAESRLLVISSAVTRLILALSVLFLVWTIYVLGGRWVDRTAYATIRVPQEEDTVRLIRSRKCVRDVLGRIDDQSIGRDPAPSGSSAAPLSTDEVSFRLRRCLQLAYDPPEPWPPAK